MGVPSPEQVLAGLDPQQREVATAPAGPVCVLAGAGTGKTRAITHRIAHRVLTGQVRGQHVLAVTFTSRAAAEMRARLSELGVGGVQARTFHAAALRQVRYFARRLFVGREMPELVESKLRLVRIAAARVGLGSEGTAGRDLAGEIEWAKSSLVEPVEYVAAAAKVNREPPADPSRVAEAFAEYERIKRTGGVIDFEDLLRAAVWAIEEHADVAEQVHAQYRHFVVDEYQDVNPLQQQLLDTWLGGRTDLTVVGDASQTIYSFTGASSSYLVDFPRRYAGARVVRLIRDYRSTPQVVGLANSVIEQATGELAGLRLELVGQREPGPEPVVRTFDDEPAEAAAVAAHCAELVRAGTPPREIAVLFRVNAQSQAYEQALATAGVPYTVQGAERFFDRPEIRTAMIALRAATRTVDAESPLEKSVTQALEATGWRSGAQPGGGAAREQWEAVAALVGLVDEYPDATLEQFCEALAQRASTQHAPAVDGVVLSSLHAAKGLEWDAVFLVGLAEGTMPTTYAKTPAALEEERRLLYVGITRARVHLWLSHPQARTPGGRARRPCRFIPALSPGSGTTGKAGKAGGQRRSGRSARVALTCRVCGTPLTATVDRKLGRCAECPSTMDEELLERLQSWRTLVAGAQRVPAYVVFTDATLTAIAERCPQAEAELVQIAGIGPRKLGLYGEAVLALVQGADVDSVVSDTES